MITLCVPVSQWKNGDLQKNVKQLHRTMQKSAKKYKTVQDYAKECHHLHHKNVQNYTEVCNVYTTGGVVVQKLHLMTGAVKVLSLAKVFHFFLKTELDMKSFFCVHFRGERIIRYSNNIRIVETE